VRFSSFVSGADRPRKTINTATDASAPVTNHTPMNKYCQAAYSLAPFESIHIGDQNKVQAKTKGMTNAINQRSATGRTREIDQAKAAAQIAITIAPELTERD